MPKKPAAKKAQATAPARKPEAAKPRRPARAAASALHTPSAKEWDDNLRQEALERDIERHVVSTMGQDPRPPRRFPYYCGLAYSIRDRLIELWLKTQRTYYDVMTKRVYYLSMEFLPGRFLMNFLVNLQLDEDCRAVVEKLGFGMEEMEEEEWDAGLGNGGLGRLASCFMDSVATLKIPAYGYGIRYDYGIFHQSIVNGAQEERADNWLRHGNPWEIQRREHLFPVQYHGRSEAYEDEAGNLRYRWVDTDRVMAMACDIVVPGYGGKHVSNMRLWTAVSSREFSFKEFNRGDYMGAMEAKVLGENITKVLYPNDELSAGKELRLKQQYFLVAATLQDILRRYRKLHRPWSDLPDFVGIQLNDTHPSIAVAELMRVLLDEEGLPWEEAWTATRGTFAYTNHTVLPEALETWPVGLMAHVLPRHLEIIFEINRRFLEEVAEQYPGDNERLARMSLIQEGGEKRVRMAHLAIVGSHSVNGVAALHSEILCKELFRDFDELTPGKIKNVTNGVTPRRWVLQANPSLAGLITEAIGPKWITDLDRLRELEPLAKDAAFREKWREVKRICKKRLSRYALRKLEVGVNPDTLFDIHVKRMHEYKRQLLNLLHVVTFYNRILDHPWGDVTPRTVFFAGKAAPGYRQAKLIIRLINAVADTVNNDSRVGGKLKVLFLPNYCISQAEKVIPAADLSEQISTAGMEASGTGNMKFSLNGALTIGTLDGANVEIMEEVGQENIFIFGLTAQEVGDLRRSGYDPRTYADKDPELSRALADIGSGRFCPEEPGLFSPLTDALLNWGDYYLLCADYRSYVDTQGRVGDLYRDYEKWTATSILNVARMGKFSSDRAILEYAKNIWNVEPLG
jgi:starch phosphorylase